MSEGKCQAVAFSRERIGAELAAKLHGAARVGLLAIGSDLRCDDVAGLVVGQELSKKCAGAIERGKLAVFMGETAPENLTGEIKRFAPTHLLIVDACQCGLSPGDITMVDPLLTGGAYFTTHKMPPNMLVQYIHKELGCGITLIGIEPRSIEFGAPPTQAVLDGAKTLAESIASNFR
jgi:hydrogenase 3 maturation protease